VNNTDDIGARFNGPALQIGKKAVMKKNFFFEKRSKKLLVLAGFWHGLGNPVSAASVDAFGCVPVV
jgi:putative SOS response-associated peptidase YedK